MKECEVFVAHIPEKLRDVPYTGQPAGRNEEFSRIAGGIREMFEYANLDIGRAGLPSWNPLGEFIEEGSHVVIKPNWVCHANASFQGLECLITQTSVIEAVLEFVTRARPGRITIGDAPIQMCNFASLFRSAQLDRLDSALVAAGIAGGVVDFRRSTLNDVSHPLPKDEFVLFDLGKDSFLEPITTDREAFRVTMYDPDVLSSRHKRGLHQYLVRREVLQAKTVIDISKLKTHAKAGISGALKNVIGISADKGWLPHHRRGSPTEDGDCYERQSWSKALIEALLDHANRNSNGFLRPLYARTGFTLARVRRLLTGSSSIEGSWYGNDTIWRTVLDLQRILRYGQEDGVVSSTPQRHVLHLTDAIVAGQGEGPLAPIPLPLGILTFGRNPAAVEHVNALLLGLDPERIPLIRHAFSGASPVARISSSEVRACFQGAWVSPTTLAKSCGAKANPPSGWEGHCELHCVAGKNRC